uniref:Uncharacterized protein n=1 Tax=Metarhizium album TaxID=92629 RepID=A0A891GWU9_9HYPO|nr:hypothetical protein K8J96_mgp22 [Metarhizium album]QRK27504.1 hypothetical protein [Metarhizium album]
MLNSPKWHELFFNFSSINLFLFINNIINNSFFLNIYILTFIVSYLLFYLDDYKLSSITTFKYIQLFIFISSPLILSFYTFNKNISIDIIYNIKETSNNIHLHGHGQITLDKETGKAINQGLSTVGTQIGLGASIVGVSTAVGKAISKSSLPPLQKTGFIVGSGLIAGLGHSVISSHNRNLIATENLTKFSEGVIQTVSAENAAKTDTVVNISGSCINKFVNNTCVSPLQEILFSSEMIYYTCLGIAYLLILQLIFKFHFKDTISLKLSKIFGNNLNFKLEYYINKLIKLNKQMSLFWIWFGLLIIIFGLSIDMYSIYKLSINMDNLINVHSLLNNGLVNYKISSLNYSMKEILFYLKVANLTSIIIIIFLILQFIIKFHLDIKIKNTYIWLLILILIVSLMGSAHFYEYLYNHINDYVCIYMN